MTIFSVDPANLGTAGDKCIHCGAHHLSDEYCEGNNPLDVGALDEYHELNEEEDNELEE